jgi:hypothetical protein
MMEDPTDDKLAPRKNPARSVPILALGAGIALIALEWRAESNAFWMILGGVLIVFAVLSLMLAPKKPE